ncbi:MAG: hypothetical protein JXB49_09610 [Bacteroidales bacterium]|nr:hypothetical protein [Bacteroidales bacterium]
MKNTYRQINKDFNKIFFREESKELFGKKLLNFLYLLLILIITFISIGFANGSLKYLKKKMDDPFIKWVDVEIPYTLANQIPDLIELISTDSLKQFFFYRDCDGYNQLTVYFFHKNSDAIKQFTGRTINIGNPILNSILSDKNLNAGRVWKDEFDIGLILTRQFLDDLGYTDENPSYIHMSYPIMENKYIDVPIPIIAIVKDLPGNNLFACTPYFYKKRNSRYFPFDITSADYQHELIYFSEGSRSKASQLSKNIFNLLSNDTLFNDFIDTLILPNYSSFNPGYDITFSFNDDISETTSLVSFADKIKNEEFLINSDALRTYNYDLSGFENEFYSYDNLSVNFNSLDRIREFSSFLFDLKNLKIDMSQIESKENYNFVSKLTIFISGFLVIFSVISIILFLSNLLKVHINKIKSNLGTFKAFGLSNTVIVRIYSFLSFRFLFFAIVIALGISLLIGETGLFRSLFRLSGTIIDESTRYFDLLTDIKTYIALAAIVMVSLLVLPLNIWKMLNKTPGDLIYKRD